MKKGEAKGPEDVRGLLKTTKNMRAFARRPHIFNAGLRSQGHRV